MKTALANPKNTSSAPFFSVIIPTLNEAKYVPDLLTDLTHQTNQDFEVIVVDGNSTDQTASKAKQFASKLPLKFLTVSPAHVSKQRNAGFREAKGSWLLFLDADNRIPNYFIQGVRYQIDKNPQVKVFSCWMNSQSYSMQDRPLIELSNIIIDLYSKMTPVAPGAMIGVQKKIFAENLFDETLSLSEDHEFLLACKEKGYHFTYFRDPQYFFSLRRFKKEGTLKMMRSYATAQLYHLSGKKITGTFKDYPMNGGSYYDDATANLPSLSYFKNLQRAFKKASAKQLEQAKKLLSLYR